MIKHTCSNHITQMNIELKNQPIHVEKISISARMKCDFCNEPARYKAITLPAFLATDNTVAERKPQDEMLEPFHVEPDDDGPKDDRILILYLIVAGSFALYLAYKFFEHYQIWEWVRGILPASC